mmetsp:Transcript_6963/g.7079  ORF Transcript_6963/g.7079 Transcript_6963/m.7079 type:complete len:234 (+) Transcript_6963:142-843(+)
MIDLGVRGCRFLRLIVSARMKPSRNLPQSMKLSTYIYLKAQEVHPDVYSALTVCFPTFVSLYWIFLPNSRKQFPEKVLLGAVGCIVHFPWSFMLHMYRAFGNCALTRTKLFKLDVSFIHFHCFCHSYAWDMKMRYISLFFHLFAIAHIWYVDPLTNPGCKKHIDIFAACGIFLTSYPMRSRCETSHFIALALWVLAFMVYSKRVIGDYSSALFHLLLAGPQYFILHAVNLPVL